MKFVKAALPLVVSAALAFGGVPAYALEGAVDVAANDEVSAAQGTDIASNYQADQDGEGTSENAGASDSEGTSGDVATAGAEGSDAADVAAVAEGTSLPQLADSAAGAQQVLADGYYTVASAAVAQMVLDVAGASAAAGANVQLYAANSSVAQIFKLTYVGGYYTIESAASGLVLDAAWGGTEPGTNVWQWDGNGSAAQQWAATANADGTYTFVNRANGLALDVSGGVAASGANVQCYTVNGTAAQNFQLTAVRSLVPTGLVSIATSLDGGMYLEVAGASRGDGANVQLYQGNATQAQKWQIEFTGVDNTYTIRSVVSGKYLAMDANGNVCVRYGNDDGSQFWVGSVNAGQYSFVNALRQKALDVDGAKTWNYTNVQGWDANGSAAQRFVIGQTQILQDGMYTLVSEYNGGQVLDVAAASSANCANVQSYTYNQGANQKWYLVNNWDGTYTVKNVQSNKVLDVAGANSAAGTNVQQYEANGSTAQKWQIVDNGNGTFSLRSALDPSMALSLSGGAYDGANACIWPYYGGSEQSFTFMATSHVFLPADQQAMLSLANNYSSSTGYLILVNCSTNKVGVFSGSQGNWQFVKYISCTSGASSSPTVKGVFKVASRGTSFGSGYTCWYWTQFYGNYLFHSVLYNPGSMSSIQDGRLGINASHGCVRLALDEAYWIYSTIPTGTTVYVY